MVIGHIIQVVCFDTKSLHLKLYGFLNLELSNLQLYFCVRNNNLKNR